MTLYYFFPSLLFIVGRIPGAETFTAVISSVLLAVSDRPQEITLADMMMAFRLSLEPPVADTECLPSGPTLRQAADTGFLALSPPNSEGVWVFYVSDPLGFKAFSWLALLFSFSPSQRCQVALPFIFYGASQNRSTTMGIVCDIFLKLVPSWESLEHVCAAILALRLLPHKWKQTVSFISLSF